MKTKFAGYYSYSTSELRDVLSQSLIVVDYSLLIDIIKLSHGRLLLNLLELFPDRLWLPYDTAWMYHQTMQKEIEEQINRINTAKKHLTSFKSSVDDPMNHPYVPENIVNRYYSLMKLAIEALDNDIKYLNKSFYKSDIKDRVLKLYDGKIGDEYNEADLNYVLDEASKRQEMHQPPCVIPSEIPVKRMQYHNYVIWKQMQKKAKECSQSIVYLTNRLNEDWFVFYKESICVTSPFLRTEFDSTTGKSFFCMSANLFVRKFKPATSQEYDKLLIQLHKTPQKSIGSTSSNMTNYL